MKTFLTFCLATMSAIAISFAESPTVPPQQTETKKTTPAHAATSPVGPNEAVGTIVEFVPGGDIVINTGATEPMRFKLGKGVRYLNPKGKEVNERKMKKDRKVRVHYAKEGNDMIVDKIQIEHAGKGKKARR